MPSSIPPAVIDASAPTSRSVFRLLARCIDATNREADSLRHALLARWGAQDGTYELVRRLQSLDRSDPNGAEGVESRLAVWFAAVDPHDGRLVAENDPVLDGLSDPLRAALIAMSRPA